MDMRPGQVEPNDLERSVLDRIADREPSIRASLEGLHVLGREYTGVGSFTVFKCDRSGAEVEERRHLGLDALIRMPSVPNGMGAVLFCTGTRPECLEIYTFGGEHWDGVYAGFSIDGTA